MTHKQNVQYKSRGKTLATKRPCLHVFLSEKQECDCKSFKLDLILKMIDELLSSTFGGICYANEKRLRAWQYRLDYSNATAELLTNEYEIQVNCLFDTNDKRLLKPTFRLFFLVYFKRFLILQLLTMFPRLSSNFCSKVKV